MKNLMERKRGDGSGSIPCWKVPATKVYTWHPFSRLHAWRNRGIRVLILKVCLTGSLLLSLPPVEAFNDDSTDNTGTLTEIRFICENGRTVFDTERFRSSCLGDNVYTDRRELALFKNEVIISQQRILDFKVSRDGRVYYRTKNRHALYNEDGLLNSNGRRVILYLVSSSGDVVYLNDNGKLFKNGVELEVGPGRLLVKQIRIIFQGRKDILVLSPAVSRNGKAIYINPEGDLFVDGKRLNPPVNRVISFQVNSQGDVYYLDTSHRLFRNSTRLFDGKFNVLNFRLSPVGKVAYLTDARTDNLFLEDQPMQAGAHRVVTFHFNSEGDIFYRDTLDRLWKNGVLIND